MRTSLLLLLLIAVAMIPACQVVQRKALFYPTHHDRDNGLERWLHDGVLIGYSRQVPEPANVWLLLHGNGGQAADRAYALGAFSERDSVFIMEYPGYGARAGQAVATRDRRSGARGLCSSCAPISRQAAVCRGRVHRQRTGVDAGAREARPPDKLVFIVPFDDLKSVAQRSRALPARGPAARG